MCHAYNHEWKKEWKEYIWQIKKESERLENRKLLRTWQYWKWTPSNKRKWKKKNKKKLFQKNEKNFRNQTQQQKSHQRNKHLGCLFYQIIWTIITMVKVGIQINGPDSKKVDDAQDLTPKRWHRQMICAKKRRRTRPHQHGCINAKTGRQN